MTTDAFSILCAILSVIIVVINLFLINKNI